jgi:CRP-like cAMP-binding protein
MPLPELTRIQTVVFLQSCDLFSYCRADEILRIAGIAQEKRLRAGEKVYVENGPADVLYCVVQGDVRLRGPYDTRSAGPLQAFGVSDILCGRLRGEDAEATVDSLVLAIEAEDLFDLLSNNIEIVKALFRHVLQDRETKVPASD